MDANSTTPKRGARVNIWEVLYDRELGGNPMPEGEARCVGCGYEGSKKVIKDGLCPYCRDDEVQDD